jgi:putative FmdB family regulatory protein
VPLYDWKCENCGEEREVLRAVRDALQPVFCQCGVPMVQQLSASYVRGDIAPYMAMAGDMAGKYITSRKEHREFLKRNRLVEVGTDAPKPTAKMRKIHTDRQRRELREQMRPIAREAIRNDKRRKRA